MSMTNAESSEFDPVNQVRADGFTVLPSVFDPTLLSRIAADTTAHEPFAEIIEHPLLLSTIRAILGDDPVVGWVAFNPGISIADGEEDGMDGDPVHSDSPWLFPEVSLRLPTFGLAVLVPLLTDKDARSGAVRLWPDGTHDTPAPVDVARLAQDREFVQPNIRVGDLLLRDLRTWHGYASNRSGVACPFVQVVYTRPWYRLTVVPPPRLTQHRFDSLTETGKRLLRYANIVETKPLDD